MSCLDLTPELSALVRRISDHYDSGAPLFDKQTLLDLERQLDEHPEYVSIQPFNGGPKWRVFDSLHPGEGSEGEEIARTIRIVGHRDLFPYDDDVRHPKLLFDPRWAFWT
ncbi:Uu.00g095330.m01.CDS01 [Anthostomella pinea]|uniref:Uu.00g095330.m01.CDS01 n=1 Tax=Anthostomella pinea TaxID=933095 RepID=A0AAI8YMQ8_9PEZI|nr:Uu.00g095330.m01.CDS01 [Anthostomella pinea]